MNGDTIPVLISIAASALALGGMGWRHGHRLGKIETHVKALLGVEKHVDDVEHRLTVIETEHALRTCEDS